MILLVNLVAFIMDTLIRNRYNQSKPPSIFTNLSSTIPQRALPKTPPISNMVENKPALESS